MKAWLPLKKSSDKMPKIYTAYFLISLLQWDLESLDREVSRIKANTQNFGGITRR